MNTHEKNIIMNVYNIIKERYKKSRENPHEKYLLSPKEYKAQCFIVMHLMQSFNFWEEYKNSNDTTTEKEWFPDME